MWARMGVAVAIVLVVVVLSKAAFGARRMSPDTLQTATLLYEGMNKWRAESHASKSLLLARDNAIYALAYANTLRKMLDDSQSRKLFGVNMMRVSQDIERELNAKTKSMLAKCPSLNPSQVGSGAAVRTGMIR